MIFVYILAIFGFIVLLASFIVVIVIGSSSAWCLFLMITDTPSRRNPNKNLITDYRFGTGVKDDSETTSNQKDSES